MKKTLKMLAILLALAMAFGVLAACGGPENPGTQSPESPVESNDPVETPPASDAPTAEPLDRAELGIPNEYTKVKTYFGTFGFGDAEITAAMNDDESAFYITYISFDEDQILIGTVQNGICLVTYDRTGFMAMEAQGLYEMALSSEEPWHPLTGDGPAAPGAEPAAEPLDRAELGIPNEYTKVKTYFGTFGFGDAEITVAMNDDESAFYITYVSFDEDQILIGTVQNGICLVTYDRTGFMAMEAQGLYEMALSSEEPWHPLVGEAPAEALDRAELKIPNEYTKVKTYFGTFGFGDAEITAAMNDDESAFYITYISFDEDQILIGTVQNGICLVTYDRTGFMAMEAQGLYELALSSEEPWHPLVGEAPAEALDRAELGIPNEYTKVKTYFGTFGFGDAEITVAMNDDESAFYITYVSFDEDQILMGTVQNGICLVTYDRTGFMAMEAQGLYETALSSEEPWHPLTGEGPVAPN